MAKSKNEIEIVLTAEDQYSKTMEKMKDSIKSTSEVAGDTAANLEVMLDSMGAGKLAGIVGQFDRMASTVRGLNDSLGNTRMAMVAVTGAMAGMGIGMFVEAMRALSELQDQTERIKGDIAARQEFVSMENELDKIRKQRETNRLQDLWMQNMKDMEDPELRSQYIKDFKNNLMDKESTQTLQNTVMMEVRKAYQGYGSVDPGEVLELKKQIDDQQRRWDTLSDNLKQTGPGNDLRTDLVSNRIRLEFMLKYADFQRYDDRQGPGVTHSRDPAAYAREAAMRAAHNREIEEAEKLKEKNRFGMYTGMVSGFGFNAMDYVPEKFTGPLNLDKLFGEGYSMDELLEAVESGETEHLDLTRRQMEFLTTYNKMKKGRNELQEQILSEDQFIVDLEKENQEILKKKLAREEKDAELQAELKKVREEHERKIKPQKQERSNIQEGLKFVEERLAKFQQTMSPALGTAQGIDSTMLFGGGIIDRKEQIQEEILSLEQTKLQLQAQDAQIQAAISKSLTDLNNKIEKLNRDIKTNLNPGD